MATFRELYEALGFTSQSEAGAKLGVSQASVSHYLADDDAPEPVMKLMNCMLKEKCDDDLKPTGN